MRFPPILLLLMMPSWCMATIGGVLDVSKASAPSGVHLEMPTPPALLQEGTNVSLPSAEIMERISTLSDLLKRQEDRLQEPQETPAALKGHISKTFDMVEEVLPLLNSQDLPPALKRHLPQLAQVVQQGRELVKGLDKHQHEKKNTHRVLEENDADSPIVKSHSVSKEKPIFDPLHKYHSNPKVNRKLKTAKALQTGDISTIDRHLDGLHRKFTSHRSNPARSNRRLEEDTTWPEHCYKMVEEIKEWSIYDYVAFFFGPYADDQGELNEDAHAADATMVFETSKKIAEKADGTSFELKWESMAIDTFLDDDIQVTVTGGDFSACQSLLQEFHRNEDHDIYTEYHPALWSDVARAQGTTKYLKLNEVYDKIGDGVGNRIFEDFAHCTMQLGGNYAEKIFFSPTSDAPRVPRMEDSTNRFDDHGRPDVTEEVDSNFIFEHLDILRTVNWDSWHNQRGWASGSANANSDVCYKLVNQRYKVEFLTQTDTTIWNGERREYPDLRVSCTYSSAENNMKCDVHVGNDRICHKADWLYQAAEPCPAHKGKNMDKCHGVDETYPISKIFDSDEWDLFQNATELIAGDKGSAGQVCGHANAGSGPSLPGYCCLDAPYERTGSKWGTKFSCDEGESSCMAVGPALAGLGEASCKFYAGTYCSYPRDCSKLKTCIEDEIAWAGDNEKAAYKEYLQDAEVIEDTTDEEKCGLVREYFGFESEHPDDEEICEDISFLRYHRAFDSLDLLFESAGSQPEKVQVNDGGETQALTPPDEPCTTSDTFDKADKEVYDWDQTVSTVSGILEGIRDIPCDLFLIAAKACETKKYIMIVITTIIFESLKAGQRAVVYRVDNLGMGNYNLFEVYENVMVLFQNMEIMNSGVNQIKDQNTANVDLIRDFNEEIGEHIISEIENKIDNVCGVEQGARRLKATSPSQAKNAACDGIDQDNDGIPDNCAEDHFPPYVVSSLDNAFTGDDGITRTRGRTFGGVKDAVDFLRNNVNVEDDCAAQDALALNLTAIEVSECSADVLATPVHWCQEEAMLGKEQKFHVPVDAAAPVVTCGFQGGQSSGGKVLYLEEGQTAIDTGLLVSAKDACASEITVNVEVQSSEMDESTAAILVKTKGPDGVKPKLYVMPRLCVGGNKPTGLCVGAARKERVYEVEVSATDEAGWTSQEVCKIIVVPKAEDTSKPTELRGSSSLVMSEAEQRQLLDTQSEYYQVASISFAVPN